MCLAREELPGEVCNLRIQSCFQGCSLPFVKITFTPTPPLESKGEDVAVKYSTSTGKARIGVPDSADLT